MTPFEQLQANMAASRGGMAGAMPPNQSVQPEQLTPFQMLQRNLAAAQTAPARGIDFEPVEMPSQPRAPERIPIGPFSFENPNVGDPTYAERARVQDIAMRGVMTGLPLGFGNEIRAGANALLGNRSYQDYLREEQARDAALTPEEKALSLFGNVTGGAMLGIPGTAKVMASKAPTSLKLMGLGATGGVLGGLTAPADSTAQMVENAAMGGGAGAVLGPAIGYAAPVVAKTASAGINALGSVAQKVIDKIQGPATASQRKLLEAMQRDGITPQQAIQRLSEMGPEAAIVDAGGKNIRSLGEAVANMPGAASQKAETFLEGRMHGQQTRVKSAIEAAVGGKSGYFEATDALLQKRAADARPLYEVAFDTPPIYTDRLQQFLDAPEIKEGLRKGMTIQRREALAAGTKFDPMDYGIKGFNDAGDPIIGPTPNMRLLDAAKRGLDEMLEQFRDTTTGKLALTPAARALDDVRKSYIGVLDELNPAYAVARKAWSGPSQALDALAMGRSALNKDAEVTAKMVAGMSPAERDFFLVGVQRDLVDRVEKSGDGANVVRKIFGNQAIRNRLEAAFDDPAAFQRFAKTMETEMSFANTRNEVLKGSQTARRLANMEEAGTDPNALVGAVRSAAEGNWMSALGGALKAGYNKLTGPNAAQREELGNLLFTPAQREAYLATLGQRGVLRGGPLQLPNVNIPFPKGYSAAVGGNLLGKEYSPDMNLSYREIQSRGQ